MSVEAVGALGGNEGRGADEVDDKSEEENGVDDLKCLDWLVNYRLPNYFACCDDSQHQFTENNLFRYCNIGSFDGNMSYEDKDQVAVNEMMIGNTSTAKKCSLLCWIYRVLATSLKRQLSLNDIYHRFIVLNPEWEKLLPNWKFCVGETLLTFKCFIYKHSLWSIDANFALKHERAALAQGFLHRCPPSIFSTYEIIDTSKKKCANGILKTIDDQF